MHLQQTTKRIKKLVSESRTNEAFKLLEEMVNSTKNKGLENDLFNLKARKNQQKQKEIEGTIDDDDIGINNSINIAIINFTDRVEKIALEIQSENHPTPALQGLIITQDTSEINHPKRNHNKNNILMLFGGLMLGGLLFWVGMSYSLANQNEKPIGDNSAYIDSLIKAEKETLYIKGIQTKLEEKIKNLEFEKDSIEVVIEKNKKKNSPGINTPVKQKKLTDKIKSKDSEIDSLKSELAKTEDIAIHPPINTKVTIKPPIKSKITIQYENNSSAQKKAKELKKKLEFNSHGIPIEILVIPATDGLSADKNTITNNPNNETAKMLLDFVLNSTDSTFSIDESGLFADTEIDIYIKS